MVGRSGRACGCQVDTSSASYCCVTLGKLSLSFPHCEMDLLKYLRLGVGVRRDHSKCLARGSTQ